MPPTELPASGSPTATLAVLGLTLPAVSPPKGAYVPAVRSGSLVFVAGQVPMTDGELTAVGRVGTEVTAGLARELSRQCAMAVLAAVDGAVGLDNVSRIVKVVGYVSTAGGTAEHLDVIDGASELFVAVFGEAGRHARSCVGVTDLPLGSPLEIEVVVEVRD